MCYNLDNIALCDDEVFFAVISADFVHPETYWVTLIQLNITSTSCSSSNTHACASAGEKIVPAAGILNRMREKQCTGKNMQQKQHMLSHKRKPLIMSVSN